MCIHVVRYWFLVVFVVCLFVCLFVGFFFFKYPFSAIVLRQLFEFINKLIVCINVGHPATLGLKIFWIT